MACTACTFTLEISEDAACSNLMDASTSTLPGLSENKIIFSLCIIFVIRLYIYWFDTVSWVRRIYDPQFTISDHEKIFGGITNNQVLNVLILSVKDVIYQKRKVGKEMTLSEVKKCLLKNLSILKSKEIVSTGTDEFVNRWNPFIQDLKEDIYTRNSWYTI